MFRTLYIVFRIKESKANVLLPEYLMHWFARDEFKRSTLFYASGSVRDTFSFNEMCRVKIPIPSLEIQQRIIGLSRTANEIVSISSMIDNLSGRICKTIIQNFFN